jgi:folate-binding protein YgfZ
MNAKHLTNRAVVALTTQDADENVRDFLQGLVTNDVSGNLPVYAALLSAQGKTMFDFLVCEPTGPGTGPKAPSTIWIDCEKILADDLVRRLSLYRLRRKIAISIEPSLDVMWSRERFDGSSADPRHPDLGYRSIAANTSNIESGDAEYFAHRLSLGISEGYSEMHEILWLETNAIELNGVSFEKGCYVGQENTARMNWRQKVNRRLVVVPIEQSDKKRRRAAYPEWGLAVDHLRVADLDPSTLPDWQAVGISG